MAFPLMNECQRDAQTGPSWNQIFACFWQIAITSKEFGQIIVK